jgi:hypothetical protein
MYIGPEASPGTGSGTKDDPYSISRARDEERGEGVLFTLLPGNYTPYDGVFQSPF